MITSMFAADGVWMPVRSFKIPTSARSTDHGRPRREPLGATPGHPNVPQDIKPVAEGVGIRGQDYDGSLLRDWGTRIGRSRRLLPVGFNYKAFYKSCST